LTWRWADGELKPAATAAPAQSLTRSHEALAVEVADQELRSARAFDLEPSFPALRVADVHGGEDDVSLGGVLLEHTVEHGLSLVDPPRGEENRAEEVLGGAAFVGKAVRPSQQPDDFVVFA
jgi:hypothetical protein